MSKNSTNVTFEDDDYEALKKLADEEDRTVAGQARHMLRQALNNRFEPSGPIMHEQRFLTHDVPPCGDTTGGDEVSVLKDGKMEPIPG